MLLTCATQIRNQLNPVVRDKDKLFVSVLAGVTLDQLDKALSFMNTPKIIRTMPNTPMQIGEGCSVYTPGRNVTKQEIDKIALILNSLGISQQVPEQLIGPIGALAGCGPAYVRNYY